MLCFFVVYRGIWRVFGLSFDFDGDWIFVFFLFFFERRLIFFFFLIMLLVWEVEIGEVFEVCFCWRREFWDGMGVLFVFLFEVWLNDIDCLKFFFDLFVIIFGEDDFVFFFLLLKICDLCLLVWVSVGILMLGSFFFMRLVLIVFKFIIDGKLIVILFSFRGE